MGRWHPTGILHPEDAPFKTQTQLPTDEFISLPQNPSGQPSGQHHGFI